MNERTFTLSQVKERKLKRKKINKERKKKGKEEKDCRVRHLRLTLTAGLTKPII